MLCLYGVVPRDAPPCTVFFSDNVDDAARYRQYLNRAASVGDCSRMASSRGCQDNGECSVAPALAAITPLPSMLDVLFTAPGDRAGCFTPNSRVRLMRRFSKPVTIEDSTYRFANIERSSKVFPVYRSNKMPSVDYFCTFVL